MTNTSTLIDRLRRLTDLGLWLAATGILLILLVRAAVSIDTSVDTWWYHLPWAARLAGLMPADAFVFDDFLEQRYAGFPLLWEWLQGQVWRLSGRPESINLLSLGSLLLFLGFLRARFRVPLHLGLLALIAVPLIQIHATAAHVDLPANLALTAALLLLPPLYLAGNANRRLDLLVFLLACALTAHIKLQLIPVVGLVFAVGLGATILAWYREGRRQRHPPTQTLGAILAVALVFTLTFFIPIKNLAIHGNPFYPMALKAGPITFDGPQSTYVSHTDRLRMLLEARSPAPPVAGREAAPAPAAAASKATESQAHLRAIGNPARWAASVFEIGMAPVLGQGLWNLLASQDPPLPPRHGGFFGWYVVLNLLLLAFLIARRFRERVGLLALLSAATLVAAFVPSQQILRYYLFWMILLVSLNLIMLRPAPPQPAASAATDGQRLLGSAALTAFLLVVYATRAEFFQPRFYFLEDLLETRRDPAILSAVERAAPACLAGERPPRFFVYASLFNPGKSYRLKTGPAAGHRSDEIPAACGPGWTPVIASREDAGLLPPRPASDRAVP